MENWTSSVTQTWWTLPWMCTEVCSLTRKFLIVSIDAHPQLSSNHTHTTAGMILQFLLQTVKGYHAPSLIQFRANLVANFILQNFQYCAQTMLLVYGVALANDSFVFLC